jgi:hypothetical protein
MHTRFTVRFRSLLNRACYEYLLHGPGGRGCHGRAPESRGGWVSWGASAVRGQIVPSGISPVGNPRRLPNGRLAPPPWCPGTYQVTVSAITSPPSGAGPHVKPFGSATFTVKR